MPTINPKNLKRGDILLNEKHHAAIYVGNGNIVHASMNEKGGIYGGQKGDQTGREICIRTYYDRPWDVVLRYPDLVIADEYTKEAEKIAADDSHGYDQLDRWGQDFDCSSLVCYVVEKVGIPVRQNGATFTGNMRKVFKKCGFIEIDTNAPDCPQNAPSDSDVKVYIVQKGDTLGALSRAWGCSIDDILKANPFIKNPNKIYIGDRLTIPKNTNKTTVFSGRVKTNGDDLNIRAGKGTNFKILGTLPNGTTVRLSSNTGEWFKLADRDGYVYSAYIIFG